jgi:hypothetical protein
MNREEHVRLYGMSLQLVERELDAVELARNIDLQRLPDRETQRDTAYYPQFTESVRKEAAAMAQYYELFYCLERSIRDLVRDRLSAEHGATWWDVAVPQAVSENVERNVVRERDAGVTVRSTERIDYTNFGELGEIVKANWQTFSDTFNSEKALNKVMTSLNILRGPIAHCCLLAEDEVVRLRLTIGDWFRLME